MGASSVRKRIAASVANVMFTNAVYFPNHGIYEGATPGMMNYSCISHVYYAFASVAADGSVFLSDEWADVRAPCDGVRGGLGSLMHLKQAHQHLQVVLSIGGSRAAETFPVVAADALRRENFARSAKGLVEASGLDGIDICWEYPSDARQGAHFLALLAALRLHLPEDRYLLTAALPVNRRVLENIDIRHAASYLDCVNLLAYDFCGPWSHKSGHQAQLYSASRDEASGSSGVSYLLSHGCPPKKIVLGIPVFGRSFLGAGGPGHRFGGVGGDAGVFEYKRLPRGGTKEAVDRRLGAASCAGADGGFVSYDNPETVKMKAAYCKQKGLGGLFYWHGTADTRETSRSLVAAGFRTLHTT